MRSAWRWLGRDWTPRPSRFSLPKRYDHLIVPLYRDWWPNFLPNWGECLQLQMARQTKDYARNRRPSDRRARVATLGVLSGLALRQALGVVT